MKVFLAGATGAIGIRLVPQLVGAGHEVIAKYESWRRGFFEDGTTVAPGGAAK
jgi:hypothetical protein